MKTKFESMTSVRGLLGMACLTAAALLVPAVSDASQTNRRDLNPQPLPPIAKAQGGSRGGIIIVGGKSAGTMRMNPKPKG